MPCNSPRPSSPCPPLQIPPQPHSRQPGQSVPAALRAASPGMRGSEQRSRAVSDAPGSGRRGRERSEQGKNTARDPSAGGDGEKGAGRAGGVPRSPRTGAFSRSAYLHTGEWGRLAQVRTASPEVSRSESINTKINGLKKNLKLNNDFKKLKISGSKQAEEAGGSGAGSRQQPPLSAHGRAGGSAGAAPASPPRSQRRRGRQ